MRIGMEMMMCPVIVGTLGKIYKSVRWQGTVWQIGTVWSLVCIVVGGEQYGRNSAVWSRMCMIQKASRSKGRV